jgi:hypothetical protein
VRTSLRLAEVCLLLCLLAAIGLCALHPIFAVDFFWHLELGELIRRGGAIPHTNLFSAAEPARPYVQFNWLWEWLAAEVVQLAGLRGMRVAQAGALVASFAGFYWVARSRVRRAELAFVCTALGFVLFEDRFQERPASLAFGLTAALCPWLLDLEQRASWQRTVGLVLLAVAWSNLHGGESLLLPLSLLALCAGGLLNRWLLARAPDASTRTAALWLALSTAALCLSPTFLSGLWHWAEAIGPQVAAGNEEWLPTYTMLRNGLRPSFITIALAPTLVGAAYLVECVRRVRRSGRQVLDARELLLVFGYLLLAEQAVRNAFLCLVPLLFMLRRFAVTEHAARLSRVSVCVALVLVGVALEDALPYAYGGLARIRPLLALDLAPNAFPELSADFVAQAQLEGGIVNDGRFGGYLIWRLWPRCHVFADSRQHFTPAMWSVFFATHDALSRIPALDQAYRHWQTELIMFRGPTFPLGTPAQFRLLYKAGDQEVYQDMRGAHAAVNLERTRNWLAAQHVAVPARADSAEIPALALQLGATRYLDQPYQLLRAREAAEQLASGARANAGGAWLERGQLSYEVGWYDAASGDFERAMTLQPGDSRPIYAAALSHFLAGHAARALTLVKQLQRGDSGLDQRKLRKLQLMASELEQRERAASR